MKRSLSWLLVLLCLLAACGRPAAGVSSAPGGGAQSTPGTAQDVTEITLWTYPVGGWGSSSNVASMVTDFHRAHRDIHVSIHVLDYENGDREVEQAIEEGAMPDLILEGPERLTANWGARGLMADLSDLWEGGTAAQIYPSVAAACRSRDGTHYIYPLCMTTHCMAINRDLFEAAGAWQYIDEETHTWSTEDFINAVAALRAYGVEDVAAVYCAGQGGDQGTRALINNLYSGQFTDPLHDRYTFNGPENVQALRLLAGMDGISFDASLLGADEIEKFCKGELAMSFCWNVAIEINQTINNPDLSFDIFPMAFPTNDGRFELQGGIWGFGIFDSGDEKRIEAAKTFIRYMTEGEREYTQAVLYSTYWPVRDIPGIYENDELMTEYSVFQQYLGDYYQVTPGWAEMRTAWWTMLQQVGAGADPAKAAAEFEDTANAAAAG